MSESTDEIWFLNRTLAVVRPRTAFGEWLESLGELSEEDRSGLDRPTGYLLPEVDREADAWMWLEAEASTLFEMELEEWVADPDSWPQDRSWEAFQRWFEVELVDLVWDLVDEPLSSEAP